MNEDKRKEFEELSRKMMKFLRDNCHPHTHVVIDCNTAELSEGVIVVKADDRIGNVMSNKEASRPRNT